MGFLRPILFIVLSWTIYSTAFAVSNGSIQSQWRAINSGWPASYDDVRARLKPNANYILFHIDMPSTPYDLRDGEKYRQSVYDHGLLNLGSYNISHFALGWRCENGAAEGLTGMTGEHNRQMLALAKAGWGLASLLSVSTDGELQSPEEVEERLGRNSGTLHTVVVEVSAQQCAGVRKYVADFLSHPNQPARYFGLSVDPMKFQGGGCGSFGLAALAHSGFFFNLQANLFREVPMPEGLFGYGLEHPSDTIPFRLKTSGTKKISLGKVATASWKAERGPMASMADPELIHLFIRESARMFLDHIYEDNYEFGKAYVRSIEAQYRTVINSATRIDKNFDAKAANAQNVAKAWANNLRKQGYKGRGLMRLGHPVVILDK